MRAPKLSGGVARIAWLPVVLMAAMSLSACGSSQKSLDEVKIEHAIADSILKERGVHATVGCPSNVRRQVGHAFTCEAYLDAGAYPVTVTELGDGGVRYSNQAPLVVLNIPKVERAIEGSVLSERHVRADVTCPAEVLQKVGVDFRCTAVVSDSGQRYPFAVAELDDNGRVRYTGV